MIKQEVIDTVKEFKHRLINTETGEASVWTPYYHYTYLDGSVGVTDYYIRGGGVFTPEDFFIKTTERI